MTRLELLTLIVGRARTHGFAFRRWYTLRLGLPWISPEAALALLDAQRRYYALIYSHEFAICFWKAGADIAFDVPAQSFTRTMRDGSVRTIHRKAFVRRTVRPNAWKYHLRQMALSEDPLRYLRRYLRLEDDSDRDGTAPASTSVATALKGPSAMSKGMPTEMPEFLKRPYAGSQTHPRPGLKRTRRQPTTL